MLGGFSSRAASTTKVHFTLGRDSRDPGGARIKTNDITKLRSCWQFMEKPECKGRSSLYTETPLVLRFRSVQIALLVIAIYKRDAVLSYFLYEL